ncbi:hypothetical protein [Nonomuraea sp. NPDC049784]
MSTPPPCERTNTLRLPGLMNLVPVRKRRDAAATVELISLPAC